MIKRLCLPFAAMGVLLAGCTGGRPAAKDPGLYTDAFAVPVKEKDGWFSARTVTLGEYTTGSRTNGVASSTPAKQIRNVSDAFYFTVKSPGGEFPVQVLATNKIAFSARPLPAWLSVLPADAGIWYQTIGAGAASPLKSWELLVKRNVAFLELNDNKPVGVLRSETEELRITAHNRFGIRNSYAKMCYEFQLRGIPVAAVIPGEEPRAWIHSKADASLRQALSGAMLGLLFNEKLGQR
ncbi:hypothetical protein ACWKWU_07750 [Chitinophaga lutea]